jgi:hypothetical protein
MDHILLHRLKNWFVSLVNGPNYFSDSRGFGVFLAEMDQNLQGLLNNWFVSLGNGPNSFGIQEDLDSFAGERTKIPLTLEDLKCFSQKCPPIISKTPQN